MSTRRSRPPSPPPWPAPRTPATAPPCRRCWTASTAARDAAPAVPSANADSDRPAMAEDAPPRDLPVPDLCDHDDPPPPLPPKNPAYFRMVKAGSSGGGAAPTEYSPAGRVVSHSVSDSGHCYRPCMQLVPGASDGAPAEPTPLTSQHMCPPRVPLGTAAFSSDAPNPRRAPRMELVLLDTSQLRPSRHNRLTKARPSPPSPPRATHHRFQRRTAYVLGVIQGDD